MRVLGLDLGTKTLGLAISDKLGIIANPYKVIRYQEDDYDYLISQLKDIIQEEKVDKLVLGLPKNMDNSLGFASQRSLNFKKRLDKELSIKTILVDERLTTKEAENFLIESNLRREKRKQVIDSAAAMIILETYLRSESHEKE